MIRFLPLAPLVFLLGSMSCATAPAVEEGFIETGGTQLYFKSIGSGEPIVVLHGGPGFDHGQFLPQINALDAEHRVILYDQRGTGLSEGPVDATSITIENFIADLEGVRERFGLERMNLLGHSWGGILAMHYAVKHPDRLRSLILCSTGASVDCFDVMRANITARRSPQDLEELQAVQESEAFQNVDPEAVAAFWRIYFRVYFADPAFAEQMSLVFPPNTLEHGNTVAGLILQSVGSFDLREELAKLTCPTLIIHGDADPMPVSYAERIRECIPGSELVVIEDVGHWLFIDGQECFTASIVDFLARLP